jgi:hypothetical protein
MKMKIKIVRKRLLSELQQNTRRHQKIRKLVKMTTEHEGTRVQILVPFLMAYSKAKSKILLAVSATVPLKCTVGSERSEISNAECLSFTKLKFIKHEKIMWCVLLWLGPERNVH